MFSLFLSLSLSLPLPLSQHGIRATFLWPSLSNFRILLLLQVHDLFSVIKNHLAAFAFLGFHISEPPFNSQKLPSRRSSPDISIATKIGRIRHRTRPHTPPEDSASPDMRLHPPHARVSLPLTRATLALPRQPYLPRHRHVRNVDF